MFKRKVYIRCDGNSNIGYGHVLRCAALADMLRNDFSCTFLIQEPSEFLINEIINSGANLIRIDEIQNYLEEASYIVKTIIKEKDIVVLDGYNFETEYQKIIKTTKCKLVCIDDIHSFHFVADIVINQGINDKTVYSVEPYSKLALGSSYALLRDAFREATKLKQKFSSIENAFVCFGGSNLKNNTFNSLKALLEIDQIKKVYFVKGSNQIYLEEVCPLLDVDKKNKIQVFENLNDNEMCKLMRLCQIAILPASSIAYEACAVGIGLFCGITAKNQEGIYNILFSNHLIFELNDFNEIDHTFINTKVKNNLNLASINDMISNQKKYFSPKIHQNYLDLFLTN